MISCTACLRRALNNLTLDQQPVHSLSISHLNRKVPSYSRNHATYDSLVKGHHKKRLRQAIHDGDIPPPNLRRKGPNALTKGEVKDAMARSKNREALLVKNDDEDKAMQRKMKKEIEQYHQDPVQLAQYVSKKLRSHLFKDALNLVRASDGIVSNNIVSWNHLIDYAMVQADTERAWKIFNEVKKRGSKPDAHTYTIMLRGFGQNTRNSNVAERAVSIYNSMFAPNSNVVPNTIHTNAVLNVCARKGDMDSLWAIAGRLPTHGAGAPDNWTFTTILNAIREDATVKVAQLYKSPGGSEEGSLQQRQKVIFDDALRDGRRLWVDISYRWRRADLIVDERLVCAMGRLILGCGTTRDFQEVYDLVDQTMNTRLRERKEQVKARAQELAQEAKEAREGNEHRQEGEDLQLALPQSTGLPLDPSTVYATPSNNTLSMLMEATVGTKDIKIGKAYWTALTDPEGKFKVQPDVDNIITYLRLLRVSRASKAAYELMARYWPAPIAETLYKRGPFVIAMSACIRDKNSPLVFDTADKLLTLMQEKLEEVELGMYNVSEAESELPFKERLRLRKERAANIDESFGEEEGRSELQRAKPGVHSLNVDPKALRMYIDLALLTTKGWHEGLKQYDDSADVFERETSQNHTLRALRRIAPDLINIRRLAKLKIEEAEMSSSSRLQAKQPKTWEKVAISDRAGTRVAENLEDLIDLLRSITSAYDRVIMMAERFEDNNMTPLDKGMIERFRDQKRMVSGFLTKTKDDVKRVMSKKLEFSKWRNAENEDDLEDVETGTTPSYQSQDHSQHQRQKPVSGTQHSSLFPGQTLQNIPNSSSSSSSSSSFSSASNFQPQSADNEYEERKIARSIRQIHRDTDSSLNRSRSLSRRQRNERRVGIDSRMARRGLGRDNGGEGYGDLGEDLRIVKDGGEKVWRGGREGEAKERMRGRAERIRIEGQ